MLDRAPEQIITDIGAPRFQKPSDATFIGVGPTGAFAARELARCIAGNASEVERVCAGDPLRITFVDESTDFARGVPFGKKAGYHALMIQSVEHIFGAAHQGAAFLEWLQSRDSQWLARYRSECTPLPRWEEHLKECAASGDLSRLHLPRIVLGWYLEGMMLKELQNVHEQGLVHFNFIPERARSISQQDDHTYRIGVGADTVTSKLSLLSIGTPQNLMPIIAPTDPAVVMGMYDVSLDHTICRINEIAAEKGRPLRVLIIGSNASALESVYQIHGRCMSVGSVTEIGCTSNSGVFPYFESNEAQLKNIAPENLRALSRRGNCTALELIQAVEADMDHVRAEGGSVAGSVGEVGGCVNKLMRTLSDMSAEQFMGLYSGRLLGSMRRATGPYAAVAEELIALGKLTVGHVALGNFDCVINCTGTPRDEWTKSELGRTLVPDLCKVNPSIGIVVDDNFQANDGLYVGGPLLRGLVDPKAAYWHLEGVSYSAHVGTQIGHTIYERLMAERRAA